MILPHVEDNNRKSFYAALVFTIVITLTLFLPVRHFEFLNFDDNEYVTANPIVNTGLSWGNVEAAFSSVRAAHWHPLTWVSHMVDVSFFGLNPGVHHLINAVIHSMNAGLFFILAYLMCGEVSIALCAAVIWGVHPLRIESVAWISERKDVLCTFFSLGTLNAYLLYSRGRKCWWQLAGLISFLLALLSKPTAITLPILLILLDYWPLGRLGSLKIKQIAALLYEKAFYVLIALGFLLGTLYAQHAGGGLKNLSAYPLDLRIPAVLVGYLSYFGKLFIPTGIAIFYPFTSYQPGVAAGAGLGLFALSSWFFVLRKKYPYLFVGYLWFLVTLIPMVGFVQIGGQAFADRWTYLAHGGLIIGVMQWWYHVTSRSSVIGYRVVPLYILIGLFVYRTATILPYWGDNESLYRHTIEVSPENFMANMNLAVALEDAGKFQEAMPYFEAAVYMKPFYPLALINLAHAKMRVQEYGAAEELFLRARGNPAFNFQAAVGAADATEKQGLMFSAIVQWLAVLQMTPQDNSVRFRIEKIAAELWDPSCNRIAQQFSSLREQHATAKLRQLLAGNDTQLSETVRHALGLVLNCSPSSH